MVSLKEFVIKNSYKKAVVFISLIFILFSTIYFIIIWVIYFKLPKIIISSINVGLSNSIVIGDHFTIQREFSSLIHSNEFVQLSLFVFNKNNIEVEINSIGKYILKNNNSFTFLNFVFFEKNIYVVQVKEIKYGNTVIAKLYYLKEFNYLLLIFIYIIVFIIMLILFIFINKQIKNLYEKVSQPIFEIEKYLLNKGEVRNQINLQFDEFYELYNKLIFYQKEIELSEKNKLKIVELSAITSTIQMLAHDLRQPFSRLKMAISYFRNAKNYQEIIEILPSISEATNKDVMRMENYLNDIMTLGREISLNKIGLNIKNMLYSCLKSCFEINKNINIKIEYFFKHKFKMYADRQKIERVFINIISNAIEAIGYKNGKIWITTNEVELKKELYLEIIIGNSDSYIPENELDKIFDLFYTKGKSKGTGLGLAIVKKILHEHKGEVECKSDKLKGVEFIIKIPVNNFEEDNFEINLPENSKEFLAIKESQAITLDKEQEFLLAKIKMHLAKQVKNKFNILILDDDDGYLNYLKSLENKISEVMNYFNIIYHSNVNTAVKELRKQQFDYFIIDIDLNDVEYNGFDFLKIISDYSESKVCIHTNRFLTSDLKKLQSTNKVDFFILKPLCLSKYLKFLLSKFSEDIQAEN